MVCTAPDKIPQEKVALLEAYGCEVITCPTSVEADDPRSYYKVAERIRDERGAFLPYQYHNQDNPQAHYRTTGPEIWRQTDGRITHWVAGIGTGGTISGVAKYLKEQNPDDPGGRRRHRGQRLRVLPPPRRAAAGGRDPPVPDRRHRRGLPARLGVDGRHRRGDHRRRPQRLPRGLRAVPARGDLHRHQRRGGGGGRPPGGPPGAGRRRSSSPSSPTPASATSRSSTSAGCATRASSTPARRWRASAPRGSKRCRARTPPSPTSGRSSIGCAATGTWWRCRRRSTRASRWRRSTAG